MLVADYIVEFLISKEISDIFGYPGGMVTHLMESLRTHADRISSHVAYHEQAAAFAACGYAQASGKIGVAYATSGPGATNLVTGICNAYFDSIPCIFITGQVNSNECKDGYNIRQRGFQETDIVAMVSGVTKYAVRLSDPFQIGICLETAYEAAISDRPGPVLLDIPMDVMRTTIDIHKLPHKSGTCVAKLDTAWKEWFCEALAQAKRPVFLFGNGVKNAHCQKIAKKVAEQFPIPIVTSMLAVDVFGNHNNFYGFVGAYGHRAANFIVAKSDLIISIGSRMDIRQIGAKRHDFAPKAKIIRFDVDAGEFEYLVHEDEKQIRAEIKDVLEGLCTIRDGTAESHKAWLQICQGIKEKLTGVDDSYPNRIVRRLSDITNDIVEVTTDVGQNQVWMAQSFICKRNQHISFSGGHGAMGYSLPAAIGACYAVGKKPVLCVAGDGGFQMNIQELQWIIREHLPIKIVILNNEALGMIRHFQEMYFNGKYFQTKQGGGYSAPNFCKISDAYGIASCQLTNIEQLNEEIFAGDEPLLVEILLPKDTYIFPKLEFGKANQDQEPLLDRKLYEEIMEL